MPKHMQRTVGILFVLIFLLLIFDARTALSGASAGLELCLKSIVPSLFPFLLISNVICTYFYGNGMYFLEPLSRQLGIPIGVESIVLFGFLCGYPVGAQNINVMYKKGVIKQKTAQRMLGFCNNAGPAFIFGILAPFFSTKTALWALWGIHIASAIISGLILTPKAYDRCKMISQNRISLADSMNQAVRSMAIICGWVLMFRVLIEFLEKWVFCLLPCRVTVLICGLLELANGCSMLNNIPLMGMRFVFCSLLLGMGGLCVTMQTISVTKECGIGAYFPGKIIQTAISVLMAGSLQYILFPATDVYANWYILALIPSFAAFFVLLSMKTKNKYSNLQKLVV